MAATRATEEHRFGSFLERLKAKLDRDVSPDELKKMALLMKDKLQQEFLPLYTCELPSNMVEYLESTMMRREVITVLKHVLREMRYHSDFGTFSFYKFIEEYEATCVSWDDDNLIGREKDIEDVIKKLEVEDCRGVWIHGLRGMGKTTLARTVGLRYRINCNWNFIVVDLKKVDTMLDVYRAILGHFSCSSTDTGDDSLKAEALSNINRLDRRTCLLLDNFEDVYDTEKDKTNAFLETFFKETGPIVKILITSRSRLDFGIDVKPKAIQASLQEYELHQLERDAAYKLLRLSCKPTKLREDQCNQVLSYCGGIPLSIRLVVNAIRPLKDDQMIDKAIQSLVQGQDQMQECIEYAFEKLNAEMKIVATLLTVFDTSTFNLSDAAAVLDMSAQEVSVMLMYLCYSHILNESERYTSAAMITEGAAMITEASEGANQEMAYSFHPLLANWLRKKQNDVPSVARDCQLRFCRRMFGKMREACKEYFWDGPRCVQYVHNNSALLKTCFSLTKEGVFDKQISIEDCFNLNTVSSIIMTDSEKQDFFKESLNNFEGVPRGCHIYWRIQNAAECIDSGRLDIAESIFKSILEEEDLDEESDSNAIDRAEFHRHYARLLRRRRRFDDAKQSLNEALVSLKMCEPVNDQLISATADVLNTFGNVFFDMKQFDMSLTYHQRAIEQMKRIKRRDEGIVPYEMSVHIFNVGVVAFEKANELKDSKDPEKVKAAEEFYNMCLERYKTSFQIDQSLNVSELPKYAEKLQIRAKAWVAVNGFDRALYDTEEALRIILKTYTGIHSKITIAKYKIGKVYLDKYRHMKRVQQSSYDERQGVLAKSRDEFNRAVADVNAGGLTMDDSNSMAFIVDLQEMATYTMNKTYIKDVKMFCLKFQRKRRFDPDSDSDSDDTDSLVEDPDTPGHSPESAVDMEEFPAETVESDVDMITDMPGNGGHSEPMNIACKRKIDSDSD